MSSTAFDNYIKQALGAHWHASEQERVYGTTSKGQAFVFVMTKGLWYAVYLFADQEAGYCPKEYTTKYGPFHCFKVGEIIDYNQFWTKSGADQYIVKMKRELESANFGNDKKWICCRLRVMPADCAKNPDKYLRRGDHIRGPFYGDAHEGIYINNGKVVHVSGHGSSNKSESYARIGDFYPNFIDKYSARIMVVDYPLRLRTRDEVVEMATNYCEEKFRHGQYNLLFKNCQHFASLCACGFEFMVDALINIKEDL